MVAKVVVCAADQAACAGVSAKLAGQPELTIVDAATTAERAVLAVTRRQPDVVIADVALPDQDGVTLTNRLRAGRRGPRTRKHRDRRRPPAVILMLPRPGDVVFAALRAGAAGVVLRSGAADELARATRQVGGGTEWFLAPEVLSYVVNSVTGSGVNRVGQAARKALTTREREVLELVALGLSNVEIADRLYIGEPTVKYHVSHVLQKLHLRDRVQAASFAHRYGLVSWR